MTTANLDSADLKGVADNGLIREDVMNQIFDISAYPLPFTEMMGAPDPVGNSYAEWTQDELQAIDLSNAVVDGSDAGTNDTNTGARVGNHCQISVKYCYVSTRAKASDTIGRSDELAYQVMMRQKELRRDVDAISQSQQASIADNGDAQPGLSAGFGAWLVTNVDRGATGANGGYGATSPGIVDEPTAGTARAVNEEGLRDVAQSVYEQGGNVTKLVTSPAVKRKISEYFYTDAAKVATLDSDVGQAQDQATAKGAVDVFVSDFAILELIPSRTMPEADTGNFNAYLIDPEYVRHGHLKGYRGEELGKAGLSTKWQLSIDWTLKVLNEKAHGVFADIDPTADMIAVPA